MKLENVLLRIQNMLQKKNGNKDKFRKLVNLLKTEAVII